jgi:hypothetical protein
VVEFVHRFAPGDRVAARIDIPASAVLHNDSLDGVLVAQGTRGVVETTAVYDSDVLVAWAGGMALFVPEMYLRLAE